MASMYSEGLVLSLLWLLVSAASFVSAVPPRLNAFPTTMRMNSNIEASSASKTETHYYAQTLDHFNYRPGSFVTFKQKYVIDFTYWAGANTSAPIFVLLGAGSTMGNTVYDIGLGHRFNGLTVGIQHRYYGESMPFGSMDNAFANADTLGYLNPAQAMADYAEIILHITKNLSAENCPVIVYGGSYGGMQASWFRLKYPHITVGALASSAPILYFDDIVPYDGYYGIVTRLFRETSESCYNTIRNSWSIIDDTADQENGLSTLSKKFKTCSVVKTSMELKDFLDSMYSVAVTYNRGPEDILKGMCDAIDKSPKETGILDSVYAGIVSLLGKRSCYDTWRNFAVSYQNGWMWQKCTDMVHPIGHGADATMFQYSPFNLTEYSESCRERYGVQPRPNWVSTEFGGRDIKQVLAKFGSNIIFTNGLNDPYSSGGVLHNISDSIVAITSAEGSHCMDFSKPSPADPEWLAQQKASVMEVIGGWIAEYKVMQQKV